MRARVTTPHGAIVEVVRTPRNTYFVIVEKPAGVSSEEIFDWVERFNPLVD